MKNINDIKNILILGSGTLGLRIGLASAINGYKVTIYDIKEEAFAQAKKIQTQILKTLLKEKIISEKAAQWAILNQTFTTDDVKAAKNADLVSE
ncbi:MAG: 3-hydroxybutyryl-CoA dehydrogenase, partial [Bacteroidia bacterium]|nr:3-hydroxybutyryl-CoA dehydrogenase [Bacteroidia bacterium]